MKARIILYLLVFLLMPRTLFGQSTTVSGQVTDSGGQSWNNGTITAVFVVNPSYPSFPQYVWTGGTLNPQISGTLNSIGAYSLSIPSNTAITPVNSQWRFQICPQATSPCFYTSPVTITGATQTLNFTPPAILINLQVAAPPISAYSTSEITGALIGSEFTLLAATPALQLCQAVSGNNCLTWGSPGGGGAALGPAVNRTSNYTAVSGDNGKMEIFNGSNLVFTLPNPPPSPTWTIVVKNTNSTLLTISPNGLTLDGNASNTTLVQGNSQAIFTDGTNYFTHPGTTNPSVFPSSSHIVDVTNAAFGGGAKFDGRACWGNTSTITITNTSNQVTCNTANYTAADVGKQFTASNGCCGTTFNYLGVAQFPFVGMHICKATDTGSGGVGVVNSTTINLCKDSDGTAANATSTCTGGTCIIAWATNDDAALSAADTAWQNFKGICGTLQFPSGITAVLQSHFVTITGDCNGFQVQADYSAVIKGWGIGATVIGLFSGFNFGSCVTNCFGGYREAVWEDFQFNGFGIGNTGSSSVLTIASANTGAQWFQVGCMGFGGSDANLTGIGITNASRAWGAISDGCGSMGANLSGVSLGAAQCHYCFFGDTSNFNLQSSSGPVYCYGCEYGGTGGTRLIGIAGGQFHQIGGSVFPCTNTNETGIYSQGVAGTTVTLVDVTLSCTGTGSNGLFDANPSNTTFYLVRSSVGGVLRNVGGPPAGIYIDDASLMSGAGSNPAPTCAFTSGGGTGPTCAIGSGSRNEQGFIVATTGTTPSSSGTITLTFFGAAFSGTNGGARACLFHVDNSATAWGNGALAQTNTQSTTAPVFAWANFVGGTLTNLTASVAYRIDYRC